jgi:hypothetical protein
MPHRRSVTDAVIDAWILQRRGVRCDRMSNICRGTEMWYRTADGPMIKCVVESVGLLTSEGVASGITISYRGKDGKRHERNTLPSRLV